jgi:hypothetical protein
MIFLFALAAVVLALVLFLGYSITISTTVTGEVAAAQTVIVEDDGLVKAAPLTILAAQPGTLTTHTTNTTGSLTMTNSGHGIVTGQRIDIFWDGGQCYGAIAGTVAGSVVPIASVSGGSNLPASSTVVTVAIPKSAPLSVVGNNLQALILSSPQMSYFVLNDGSSDVFAAVVQTGGVYTWAIGSGVANPLATFTPIKVWMSHTLTTAPVTTMKAVALVH